MIEPILIIIGVTALVMISPGPDMVIVLRNTLIGGRAAGMRTSLGVLLGNAVHMTYCVLGIGWIISQSILAFSLLKYAGAIYLVHLGIASLRSNGAPLESEGSQAPGTRSRRDERWLVQGFVNNVLNPKGTLFYLGVFTMVITPEMSRGTTALLMATMMAVSASFWVVFVVTLDRPAVRDLLTRGRKTADRVFGALLIGLGLRVAVMDR